MALNAVGNVHLTAPVPEVTIPSATGSIPNLVSSSYPSSDNVFCCTFTPPVGEANYASDLASFAGFQDVTKYMFNVIISRIEVTVDPFMSDVVVMASISEDQNFPARPSPSDISACFSHFFYRSGATGATTQIFELKMLEGMSSQIKPLPIHAFMPRLALLTRCNAEGDAIINFKIYYRFHGPLITKVQKSLTPKIASSANARQ